MSWREHCRRRSQHLQYCSHQQAHACPRRDMPTELLCILVEDEMQERRGRPKSCCEHCSDSVPSGERSRGSFLVWHCVRHWLRMTDRTPASPRTAVADGSLCISPMQVSHRFTARGPLECLLSRYFGTRLSCASWKKSQQAARLHPSMAMMVLTAGLTGA